MHWQWNQSFCGCGSTHADELKTFFGTHSEFPTLTAGHFSIFALGTIQRIVQKVLPCFIPSSQSLYTMIFHIFASSGIITVNILRICVYILRIVCYVRCIAVKSCTVGLFIEPFLRMLLRIAEHFVCYRTTLSQRE